MSRLFPELDGDLAPPPPVSAPTPLAEARAPAPNAMPVAPTAAAPAERSEAPRQERRPERRQDPSRGQRGGLSARGIAEGAPVRSCVIGGVASLRRFDTLLGLPGPLTADGGCHVVAVRAFREGDLEIEVLGGGVPRTTITFAPPEMGPGYVSTPGFGIGYRGSDLDDKLQSLLRRIAARLEQANLLQLLKVILMDPQKRVEESHWVDDGSARVEGQANGGDNRRGPDEDNDPADMLNSLVQVYGSGEAWANFFADKEQQRNFCHNVSGSIVMVSHEDLECHYATPVPNDGTISFYNYPKLHDRYTPDPEQESGEASILGNGRDPLHLVSDLHDLDVIKGGAKKLDRALDSILEFNNKPEMVVVRATCVPIVIGDDMEGSVDRFKKKTGLPVVYLDNIADQYATPFREVFRKLKDDAEFNNPQKIPGAINLLGFPRMSEMAPLLDFLGSLGVTVNCRILPEVDLKVMRGYTRAELAVLFDTSLYDSSYREIVGDIELPSIRPTAPYGVRYTRQWLWEIASSLGRSREAFEAAWAVEARTFEDEWTRLRKEAVGYRLGFVLDDDRLRMLAEPRLWLGIPILDVLREMGFGLDLLLRVAPGATEPPKALAKLGDLGAETKVSIFSTPEELGRLLRASEAQAFYSDIYFDRRLTRSGKGQFSTQVFEVGVEGAIAALKRLLAVCRMPFYRKYAGYLGQPFGAGLPKPQAANHG